MHTVLLIAVACQLGAVAEAFLDDCSSLDRDQRLGGVRVVDALETFHRDLVYVRACTEAAQPSEFGALFEEMRAVFERDPGGRDYSTANQYAMLTHLLQYLRDDQLALAEQFVDDYEYGTFTRGWATTYFDYLAAEVRRLLADYDRASSAVLAAFEKRRRSAGVSMNQLARLDGLLALQSVAQFNADLNRVYGLGPCPNHHYLGLVHLVLKGELAPLGEIKSAMASRHLCAASSTDSSSSSSSDSDNDRGAAAGLWPDFGAQSVSRESVDGVLCEFARKVNVVGEGGSQEQAARYSAVLDQLTRLDAGAARELHDEVVRHIGPRPEQAGRAARDLWLQYEAEPGGPRAAWASFVAYFHVELNLLRPADGCSAGRLDQLLPMRELLLAARRRRAGLSLGSLADLEARVVLHLLRCFHERLRLAYGLDGGEDAAQLAASRSRLGASTDRTLPDSVLVHRGAEGPHQ